jgi:hypothetical protein
MRGAEVGLRGLRSTSDSSTFQRKTTDTRAGRDYSRLLTFWRDYRFSSQIYALARICLQPEPTHAKVLRGKGFKVISACPEGQFPKLDVAGSNPVARSVRRRLIRF